MARVRAGEEVIIESGAQPVAILHSADSPVCLLSESLRLAQEHGSSATSDGDFVKDVEAAVESHREPLASNGSLPRSATKRQRSPQSG